MTAESSPPAATPDATPADEGAQPRDDRGTTTIEDSVVSKLAATAARGVAGVAGLGGRGGGVMDRLRGPEHATTGVSVEVGDRQAAIDVTLKLWYPAPIRDVADSVREAVTTQVRSLTGLEVVEVNINITGLVFPGEDDSDQQQSARVE